MQRSPAQTYAQSRTASRPRASAWSRRRAGTLYHHQTDSRGLVEAANLIVATAQNNAAMNMSVERAAQKLIKDGEASDELLDRVEMAFRAYDPCLACATHALPGQMPLTVRIHRSDGVVRQLCR